MLADAAWSRDLGGPAEAARQATYLARVYAAMAGRRFDVIHDHTGFEGLLLAIQSGLASVVVHTIHGELTEPMITFYKEVAEQARLCAISLSQAASAPDIKLAGIVHNAVELPTAPPGSFPCSGRSRLGWRWSSAWSPARRSWPCAAAPLPS